MILLATLAFAEPYRATLALTGGMAGPLPAFHAELDYGVVRHLSLAVEGGVRTDGAHALGAGLLLLPWDGRWARLGLALEPEVADPFGAARFRGRIGALAGWLALWGVGLTGRCDLVLGPEEAPGLEWGLGLSFRM